MARATFTKRERAAIAMTTVAFVVISAVVHFVAGSAIESHLPHWGAPAPEQSPFVLQVDKLATPTPTPTPLRTPPPVPTASHPIATHTQATPSTKPPWHPNPPIAVSSPHVGPGEPTQPPSTNSSPPSDIASPQGIATTAPAANATIAPKSARFKNRVVPAFPPVCVEAGAGGTVVINVTIGPDGSVEAVDVGQTSGYTCLDRAALDAAKESTYWPPEVDGRPISETYRIIYDFAIDS